MTLHRQGPLRFIAVVLLVLSGCKRPEEQVDPKVRADGYYLSGTSAFLKGDFAEAHAAFAEVRKLNPGDPRLPAAEGEVYLSEMKLAEAIQSFEDATRIDPKRSTNWSRLGYLYVLKNETEKAKAALEKAIALNPKDFNAHEAMGDLELKGGRLESAVSHYLLAAEVAQGSDRADLVLKATTELLEKKQEARALEVLESAVKKGIESPALWAEYGDRLVVAERLADAADAYEKAAKADPKDPTLWELTGEVRVKLGRLPEGEAAFRESLKVQDRSVVHVALARLCQQKKDDACLKQELDLALAKASGEELRETTDLADLLASLGRKKDALILLRAVSEEPEQKDNFELQVKTARLARDLKDEVTVKAACTRALASGQAGLKCP
ncbi:MAG: tetratricopeptide repeat protein [Myxococcota bacterium]